KPDPSDGPAVVFTALSDDFTVNRLPAALKRDSADLARVIKSSKPELVALAKDARAVVDKRLQLKAATEVWRRSAKSPRGINEEFVKNVLHEYFRRDAPALEDRNPTDDLIMLLQTSEPNDV